MLQIPAHDAGHMDVLRPGGDARAHTADAPQDELHLNPRLAGLRQLVDDLPLGHGVGLDADKALRTLGNLSVDQLQQPGLDPRRGGQQVAVGPLQVPHQHVLEEGRAVPSDLLVGGHEAQVRVLLVGVLVVISGADLGDVAEPVSLPEGDEADLAVALIGLHSVDHLTPRLLQQP